MMRQQPKNQSATCCRNAASLSLRGLSSFCAVSLQSSDFTPPQSVRLGWWWRKVEAAAQERASWRGVICGSPCSTEKSLTGCSSRITDQYRCNWLWLTCESHFSYRTRNQSNPIFRTCHTNKVSSKFLGELYISTFVFELKSHSWSQLQVAIYRQRSW